MKNPDPRLKEYYLTNQYKGFYKIREQEYKLAFKTHLTFSNGKKEIFATGMFKEAVLKKIFDKIDKLTLEEHTPQKKGLA